MWPKALTSLIELAPHVARLLPMADQFFKTKTADADASRSAMEQMADGLRGDLGQVTASHAGLYRQLNDQSEKLSTLTADLRSTRFEITALDNRLLRLETQNKSIFLMLVFLSIAAIIIIILLAISLRHHA